jgi:hypothetical protein
MPDMTCAARLFCGGLLALGLAGCTGTKLMAPALDEPAPVTSGATPLLAKNKVGQIVWIGDTSTDAAAPALPLFDNLEIVNPSLKDKLAVLRVGAGRSDSNLLSVFAGVKNKTAHPLDLEMQTVYRDKDGNSLTDGRGSWIAINLKPHEETQYRSVAISEDATDFVVRIRHAPGTAEASQ